MTDLQRYGIIIRNGMIYDGSGDKPYIGDLAISGDRIAAVGELGRSRARLEIEAGGLAVAPGFINMLSWSCESLIEDGRSQSEIRQGVTLEVMGEGFSYGPLNEALKQELVRQQGDIHYDVAWSTLGEYLEYLERGGVSTNVASFVGSGTLRAYVMGYADRRPTPQELGQMQRLARQAMEEGALGLSSALMYVPESYYRTEELAALAKTAAEYDSLYIAHIRNEGDRLLESVEEFLAIAEEAQVRAEIYHLKASGQANWHKLGAVVQMVEAAHAKGMRITADMYPYTAASTGLEVTMPPWVQEGGHEAWIGRLKDAHMRQRVLQEMVTPSQAYENTYLNAGSPENVLFVDFKNPALKHLTGKTLAEVAAMRGTSPEETIIDLVIEDDSRVGTVYFVASEENLRKQIKLPWVSFCSDAASQAPEGSFLKSGTHPRAYGAFARLLGRYVRDERLISLEEAVRRLTSLPAGNLHLERRGLLKPGYYADVVIFDPDNIQDHATYTQPHQYASGVAHVFVNGVQVLANGEHSGAKPGRFVKRGW